MSFGTKMGRCDTNYKVIFGAKIGKIGQQNTAANTTRESQREEATAACSLS